MDIANEIISDNHMLRQLLNNLLQSISNPWTEDDEPGCYFCGCVEFEDTETDVVYGHVKSCPWVMAMTFMDFPLLNHAVYLGRIDLEPEAQD